MFEEPTENITIPRQEYENDMQELHDLREMRQAVVDYFQKTAPELMIIFKNAL